MSVTKIHTTTRAGWLCACLICAACSADSSTLAASTSAPAPGAAGRISQTPPTGSAGVAGRAQSAGASAQSAGSAAPGQQSVGTDAAAGRRAPTTSPATAAAADSGPTATGQAGAAGSAGNPAAGGSTASAGHGGRAGESATGKPTGPCDFPDPPANVASWVDQSWEAQLGSNIESRQAWNLDNVVLNNGSLNLCVRWGATTAVPAEVRMNLASTVERWFNDWFKSLGSYGCFPYAQGIKVKVTGWAVRAGRESLLGDIDPSIPVYTEQDAEGEPKCPDACSSFVHWDHEFSDCKAGEDMHSDYWLWFDDMLPGGGGAEAVGGDWGLRMPVSTFLRAFDKPSDNIVEHEMGHGFGFQDYYDWRGAKPEGGSIMIVGSSQSDAPTLADSWLLRRTWKEMKKMRGW